MKRLVLCCDGTWNRADQEHEDVPCPTNVVKIAYRVAKKDNDISQIVYYDQGVGTGNVVDRYSGGAFGHGLEENIYDAYRFLIANYEDGDEVFIFGFSRGAFTARSLAGMIRNCGILKRASVEQYREAIRLYRDRGRDPDHPYSKDFRTKHSVCGDRPVPIKFIGVFDTVGALGIPLRGLRSLTRQKYQFHDTELSGTVEYAFHALAIDERRGPFAPTMWLETSKEHHVEQMWFAGVHSDIGGGYPETDLSDITLEWMLDQSEKKGGLALDQNAMNTHSLYPCPKGKLHQSKKGLYRLTKGIDRPIGLRVDKEGRPADEVDRTQHVHETVRERWQSDPEYRPDQLLEYFRRTGDPLAE